MRIIASLPAFLLLLVGAINASPSARAATAPAATVASAAAPADEYFGHMKMSVLGIRNELTILDKRIGDDPVNADRNMPTCDLVEDALENWASKYPSDSWLQGDIDHLESVYAHVGSLDGRLHLAHLVSWVHEHLAGSPLDLDAEATAAKFFDVPLHTADAAATPDPLDPTAPAPGAPTAPATAAVRPPAATGTPVAATATQP